LQKLRRSTNRRSLLLYNLLRRYDGDAAQAKPRRGSSRPDGRGGALPMLPSDARGAPMRWRNTTFGPDICRRQIHFIADCADSGD